MQLSPVFLIYHSSLLFNLLRFFAVAALVYGYGLVLATPFFMSLTELAIMVSNTGND